jgi:iron complex outermembrane receptor protein
MNSPDYLASITSGFGRSLGVVFMRLTIAAAAFMSMVSLAFADPAQAAIRMPTDIPAQGLGPALKTLAKDRGFQVVFRTEVVGDVRTHGASGDLTTSEALMKLLEGTNLAYSYIDENTVTILSRTELESGSAAAPQNAATHGGGSTEAGNKEGQKSNSFRLAQANQGVVQRSAAVGSDAQTASVNSDSLARLEEIVVTAQKREERLQDVPISIVAISGKELEDRNITSLDELSFSVPGMAIASSGSDQRRIEIRGISNVLSGTFSQIGMYLDEADVTLEATMQPDLSAFDLERVEVLRGPQGTLYGAGSAGGTIRFITNSPVLDKFGLNASVAQTFSQYGAPGERINAMLNVPEIPGELALRIAGVFDQGGGWIDVPAAHLKNFNGDNVVNVRIKELWQPVQQFTVNATAVIYRNDTPPNFAENPVGILTPSFGSTIAPSATTNYDIYNLTLDYDFGSFHVLNSTSYLTQNKEVDNFPQYFQVTPPGTPLVYATYSNTVRDSSFNDEFRVASSEAGPWRWTAGVFYKDQKNYSDYRGSFAADTPAADFGEADLTSKSWSMFGDTSYQLWDRLTLGVGVRSFHDDETFISGVSPSLTTQSGTFHSVDPRFYAQLKAAQDINLYASAAKGFRSGGFNALGQPTYGPEDVWTYEFGTKTSLLQGQLSANVDVFYSDYTNYQIQSFLPENIAISLYKNGGDATIKGIEWDFKWRPIDQWTLALSGDYLHAVFTKIAPYSENYTVGDPVDGVPKYTFTASVQRDFTVSAKSGFVRLDYAQQGPETYSVRSIGPWYVNESDTIRMLDFNASVNWTEHLRLGAFVENLLNDRGFTTPFSNEDNGSRSRPRTFGLSFGVKFD